MVDNCLKIIGFFLKVFSKELPSSDLLTLLKEIDTAIPQLGPSPPFAPFTPLLGDPCIFFKQGRAYAPHTLLAQRLLSGLSELSVPHRAAVDTSHAPTL